jgi:hypothetical protein
MATPNELRKTSVDFKRHDLIIKWLTLVVTAVGFAATLLTIWINLQQFRAQQEDANKNFHNQRTKDFQMEFWKTQLDMYKEICAITGTLATHDVDSKEYKTAYENFENMYWGKLCIVESQGVESAMVDFGEALKKGEKDLTQLALKLAHECRTSSIRAFELEPNQIEPTLESKSGEKRVGGPGR